MTPALAWALTALLIAVTTGFVMWAISESGQWHYRLLFPFDRVRDINGEMISGEVMRRKVRGEWQYRQQTSEEHQNDAIDSPF